MKVRMTFCHGNEDVVTDEFDDDEAALLRAEEIERERGCPGVEALAATFSSDGLRESQYGTGYHWVTFERLPF